MARQPQRVPNLLCPSVLPMPPPLLGWSPRLHPTMSGSRMPPSPLSDRLGNHKSHLFRNAWVVSRSCSVRFMLRPGEVACPAPARAFTTELAWAGSPRTPRSVITGGLLVIYHRRTCTGWTGSLMGCARKKRKKTKKRAHPVLAYLPDPGTPQDGRTPGGFGRQVSRKARRKARRRQEAVQGEGREVSLVPRNRRQHRRWRSGVAILRVRKERNRTPAEEDLHKAGSAGVRALPDSRLWAVCKWIRPMNRTSRGRSRAVVSEGTREGNVRPTTPLNRLLGLAAGVGRAAWGGSFGERQRRLGGPPLPRMPAWGRAWVVQVPKIRMSLFSLPRWAGRGQNSRCGDGCAGRGVCICMSERCRNGRIGRRWPRDV